MLSALTALILAASGPRLDVRVGAGVDSNPFELPYDPEAAGADAEPQPGAFVPVEADASWGMPTDRVWRAGIDADFEGRFFGWVRQDTAATQPIRPRDASRWSGAARLPLVFEPRPARRGTWGLEITVEPFVEANRETYTSHRDGRPLRIGEDTNGDGRNDTFAVIGRRFDTNEGGVRFDGDLSLGRLADVVVGGRRTRVDYVEDYEGSGIVDSWDFDETRGDADLILRPGRFVLAAGYTLRHREYDERFPRSEDGDKVRPDDPDYEPQVFTYHDITLRTGIVGERGRAVLRWRGTRRVDAYRGYQDYSENKVSGDVRLAVGADSTLSFGASYSVRTYDDLRVNFDPQEPVTDRRRATANLGFEWPALSRWTRFYVSAGMVAQSSQNPLYSYVRFQGSTGVRYRFR